MREPIRDWMNWQPTGRQGWWSGLVLTPSRVIVGIGAVLACLGGLMPWAEGTAPGHLGMEPVFFSGLGGAGDGFLVLILAGLAGFLTLHRTPATSRVRTVRLAPAVLVGLAAFTWISGYRAALAELDAWYRRGGHGDLALGLWLAGLGILAMAAGTAWLLPSVIRWRRAAGDPTDLVTIRARDVAVVVGGIVGTLLGGAVGVEAGLALTGPRVVGTLAVGAVFGGLLGAYAGAWAVRLVLDMVGGPPAPGDDDRR